MHGRCEEDQGRRENDGHKGVKVSKGCKSKKEGGRKTLLKNKNKAKDVVRITVEGKKTRSFSGYLEKKFTPSIMTDVLLNLSAAQNKWVKAIGFGWLLEFRMLCNVHILGYNVVDAFDSKDCSLNLTAGKVMINEMVVHNVLGLPNGSEEIKFSGAQRISKN
ncbi:hypothetical protein DCAR_0310449 [Daucus carota subsp. sativus]|uniref:Uncharacterized protein n=1 Tax=Daucus carota subsp. sativus TaxID=79200 RepID=A0A165ZVL8_DAUCS|nr:hypothetical protein DCAR_0310449 [Daucus carota subsp. sativus]